MREAEPPICYLVGTPRARLSKLQAQLLEQPWKDVRPGLEVKLLAQEKELYILALSRQRLSKERAIRRRRLKKLWQRLARLVSRCTKLGDSRTLPFEGVSSFSTIFNCT